MFFIINLVTFRRCLILIKCINKNKVVFKVQSKQPSFNILHEHTRTNRKVYYESA